MLISGSSSIAASLGASALSRLDRFMAPKTPNPPPIMSARPAKTAKDEFLDYAKMTPPQKMRASMLAKLGVTEEQLKAMSPEERQEDRGSDQGDDQGAGHERRQGNRKRRASWST
jgi:hypothetical protein